MEQIEVKRVMFKRSRSMTQFKKNQILIYASIQIKYPNDLKYSYNCNIIILYTFSSDFTLHHTILIALIHTINVSSTKCC